MKKAFRCNGRLFIFRAMQQMNWEYREAPEQQTVQELKQVLNINEILTGLLVQRGITTFEQAKLYFRPSIHHLHDPFLMKDMDKAVQRLSQAIQNNERIVVYGDYDVDGSTSVSLVYSFLRRRHRNLGYYIPDRYREGYGISEEGVRKAANQGTNLIIALDCGINAHNNIALANELGMNVIVCDHHRPKPELPPAHAILDPKQADCQYPYKELCGCGVGFKLLQGYCQASGMGWEELYEYLDLVAIATASDIVPITGENRVLAYHGLIKLGESSRPGIIALKEVAGLKDPLTITNIVFGIGPRINAAGRLEHAHRAVELLVCESMEKARKLADEINTHNTSRKQLDQNITSEAIRFIEENENLQDAHSTVLFNEAWHKGVIGIVASRCIEAYYRPTIILTGSGDKAVGSARSVEGFDVFEAISACSELLDRFGGHTHAAGLTLPIANIAAFQQRFEEVVSETIEEESQIPVLSIDMPITLDRITDKFYRVLHQMEPFGPANKEPVFVAENLSLAGKVWVMKDKHIKFDVQQQGNNRRITAVGFGMRDNFEEMLNKGKNFRMAFTVDENIYRGRSSLQLLIKDIKEQEIPA